LQREHGVVELHSQPIANRLINRLSEFENRKLQILVASGRKKHVCEIRKEAAEEEISEALPRRFPQM
jgi:dihydropteroate synthase